MATQRQDRMKDRFSRQASQYATFRPRYPKELFDFIFSQVKTFDQAWDAGTGNGQSAVVLAERFSHVFASDISAKQLEQAPGRENVEYAVAGETTKLSDHSVDLVTVAQAIHWFDRKKFYHEVRRVAKPGAIVAVWAYSLLKVSQVIDPLIENFYKNVIGPYWDPERRLIDEQLKTIDFPFTEMKVPPFDMKLTWSLEELEGYLGTWSAVKKYEEAAKENPVPALMATIRGQNPSTPLSVSFPLFVRMGRI